MQKYIELYLSGYLPALILFIVFQKYTKGVIYGKDFVKAFIYSVIFSWAVVITTCLYLFYDLADWISERQFWNKKIF